jgi:hypothetical protein
MGNVKQLAQATLIGDVVGSRAAPDRQALHEHLAAALRAANETHRPHHRLTITVGDEFQGTFSSVGLAITAAFTVHMQLAPETSLRFGFGWGEVVVLDADGTQDGPGWWSAREAIDWVKATERRAGLRSTRSAFRIAEGGHTDDAPEPHAVNAALLCRDGLMESLDHRSLRILRGLMAGRSQTEIAAEEGISPSAVSQRIRSSGLAVILAAQAELEAIP